MQARSQLLDYRSPGDQAVNDNYYCDDEQNVNQSATDMHHKESQNPQDQQNHRDRPKH